MNCGPLSPARVSIGLSVAAQSALKAGISHLAAEDSLSQPPTWSGFVAMLSNGQVMLGFLHNGLGAVVWLQVLARGDVSKAYPLVGLGFVATLVTSSMAGESVGTVGWGWPSSASASSS